MKTNTWISVNDALPEPNSRVLVWDNALGWQEAYYDYERIHQKGFCTIDFGEVMQICTLHCVTHWMQVSSPNIE